MEIDHDCSRVANMGFHATVKVYDSVTETRLQLLPRKDHLHLLLPKCLHSGGNDVVHHEVSPELGQLNNLLVA